MGAQYIACRPGQPCDLHWTIRRFYSQDLRIADYMGSGQLQVTEDVD